MKRGLAVLYTLCKKGLFHIFAGSFMTKIISFFGSIFLVRVLSKHEYGILGYLENIYGYAFVLAGMGMSNSILRYVVLAENTRKKNAYFEFCWREGLFWNVGLVLFIILGSAVYPHPEEYEDYVWLLYLLLLALPYQYLADNILCNERAMFANKRFSRMSFILSASIIFSKIICGYLNGIQGVVFSQVIVYATIAVSYYYITQKTYYFNSTAERLDKAEKKEIRIYALQYMVTNGLWAIFMLNDTFLLGRFCGPEIIAEYKVAYAIPGSVSILSSAIGVFVCPYFVKNEKNVEWIRVRFKQVYVATAVCVGAFCAVIAILAKPIIWFLYGEQYLNVSNVMIVLLVAAFLNCGLRYTTANILASMGKVKYNMFISIMGMMLQLGINMFVIPKYGAIGVAITSCAVYGFMAVSLFVIFYRYYYWENKIQC